MRRVLAAVVAVLAFALAGRAYAQPSAPQPLTPEARARLDAGLRDFQNHAYDAAIAEFREGYRLQPHPDFLYALAQAERMSGDCAGAVQAYRQFLQTDPPANEAEIAKYNIARCEAL